MFFKSIEISDWQQFDHVSLDLSTKVVIITGANGSGKTTIASQLGRHFGYKKTSLATPISSSDGKITYTAGLFGQIQKLFEFFKPKSNPNQIGTIGYNNGQVAKISLPTASAVNYETVISQMPTMPGVFMPSHRPHFVFQKFSNFQMGKRKSRQEAHTEFYTKLSNPNGSQPIGLDIKTALIKWAIDGNGVKDNSNDRWIRRPHIESKNNYNGFTEVLKNFLPDFIGFERFELTDDEVVFVCKDGKEQFLLETASGGITSLIAMAWLLFNFSQQHTEFTFVIDEVENHLHPSLQREVLQRIINNFPKARVIATTHSPLVVNSVEDANVYALRLNDRKRVESILLKISDKTASANRILNEILGVTATYPIWAEKKIDVIIERYKNLPLTEANVERFKAEISDLGYNELIHAALGKWFDAQD